MGYQTEHGERGSVIYRWVPHKLDRDEAPLITTEGLDMKDPKLMDDAELLRAVTAAVAAIKDANAYLDQLLLEGQGRQSIRNPLVAEAAGLSDRGFYKRLRGVFPTTHAELSRE